MKKDIKIFWKNCTEFIYTQFIQQNLPLENFNIWFKPIRPVSIENNTLTIEVPSQFFYEYIEENYSTFLKDALVKELGEKGKLVYLVAMEHSDNSNSTALTRPSKTKKNISSQNIPPRIDIKEINPIAFPGLKNINVDPQLNSNYNFENFIEGKSNKLVCTAGKTICKQPGNNSFNPLFVHGESGVGKTHFANATGLEIKDKFPKKVVLYVSSEIFMQKYMTATRENKVLDFIHFFKQLDVLIVDDIQFLSGKKGTQDVFFDIFNYLHQNHKQVIITCDKSPSEVKDIDNRLLSRFKWGLSAEIKRPGVNMRKKIIENKTFKDGLKLRETTINYIAEKVNTNIRELEGVLTAIIAYSLIQTKEIGLPLVKEIISNYISRTDNSVTIDDIQEIVCKYFDLDIDDIKSKTRKRYIVQARHITMFLSKKYTKSSTIEIGKKTGNRDHSTVLHACKSVNSLIDTDKQFKNYIKEIENILKN